MQQLDDEWRKLDIMLLPFDSEDMDLEVFFSRLSSQSDGTGNPLFGVLCRFMQTLLCLPHSNVVIEWLFSDVSAVLEKPKKEIIYN